MKRKAKLNVRKTKLKKVENEIQELEEEIERLKQKIKELKQSIKETKRKIEQREDLLTDRLRNLQRNGGSVKYLQVIMGASDFGDFISRTQAVSKIMDQDQAILREHLNDKMKLEKDKQELEDSKAQVEENKNQLSAQRDQLEGQKESLVADMRDLQGLESSLNDKLSEQNTLLANLQKKEEELHDHKMSIDEERANLASQKRAFDKLIDELEAQKRAEKKAAQSGGTVQQTTNVKNDSGFIRPTSGVLTSGFGGRWGDLHAGIDISRHGPGVAVKAAASGVVSRSYYSSSYGNVVFIVHMVNGQKYTTVYAHMRNRLVSEGQTVSQGQVVGHQGNTGRSYGQHLHFELHKGSWNMSKSNAVNPASYGIQ